MNFSYYYGTDIGGGHRTVMVSEMKNREGGVIVTKTVSTSRGGNGYKRTSIYPDKDAMSLMPEDMVNVKVEQFRCSPKEQGFFLRDLQDCFGSIRYAMEHNPSIDCFMNQQLLSSMVNMDMNEALAEIGLAQDSRSLSDSLSDTLLSSCVCICRDASGLEGRLVPGCAYPAQDVGQDEVSVICSDGSVISCMKSRFEITTVKDMIASQKAIA